MATNWWEVIPKKKTEETSAFVSTKYALSGVSQSGQSAFQQSIAKRVESEKQSIFKEVPIETLTPAKSMTFPVSEQGKQFLAQKGYFEAVKPTIIKSGIEATAQYKRENDVINEVVKKEQALVNAGVEQKRATQIAIKSTLYPFKTAIISESLTPQESNVLISLKSEEISGMAIGFIGGGLRFVNTQQAETIIAQTIKSKLTRQDLIDITAGRLKSGAKYDAYRIMAQDETMRKELTAIAKNQKISITQKISDYIKNALKSTEQIVANKAAAKTAETKALVPITKGVVPKGASAVGAITEKVSPLIKPTPIIPPQPQKGVVEAVKPEKGIIPKELKPLAEEARKYKSAEEFVSANVKGKPLYHGTTEVWEGKEPKFNLYLTEDKVYAQHYADNKIASSITFGKKGGAEGTILEYYRNPKARILDVRKPEHLEIINDYWRTESVSGGFYPSERGLLDWTEAESLSEYITERKLPFDAILIDEGGIIDPLTNKVKDRGIGYVALNKNAIVSKSQLIDIYNQAVKGEVKPTAKPTEVKPIEVKPINEEQLSREIAVIKGEGFTLEAITPKRVLSPKIKAQRVLKKEQVDYQRQQLKLQERQIKNNIKAVKELERTKASQTIKEIKEAKDQKLTNYKTGLKDRQQKALDILDKLPPELQGRMKQAIKESTTDIRLRNLERRVNDRLAIYERQQALKEAKTLEKMSRTVAITTKYQRLIKDLTSDYDFKKPTEKTITRLKATRQFLERNPEAPIPKKYIDEIKRLEQKSLRTITIENVKEFNETIGHLIDLGKEIQRHRILVSKLKFGNELNKAIEGINNLDSKFININRALETENAFEFRFRVADKTDGNKMYSGWHAKMVKSLGRKVNIADINQADRMNAFWEEHLKIDNTTLSEIEQQQVAAHIYYNQGALIQSSNILKKLKVKELPKLSEKQTKIKNALIKAVGEKTKDVQTLWETTMVDDNGRPMEFRVVEGYFPLYYEERFSDLGIYSILQDYRVQSKIIFGSGFKRVPGVDLTPRTDIYKMAQEAIAKQELFLNLQPTLFEKGSI
ncbi:MAG: hypothetical protein KKB31_01705, partial [Nanoarchaeota archaeon]|nr:hypothetical protein [Nanoarchaeota archaeon]